MDVRQNTGSMYPDRCFLSHLTYEDDDHLHTHLYFEIAYRAMFWSAHKEEEMRKAFSSNPDTECSYFPEIGMYVIVNNSTAEQKTVFYDINGKAQNMFLERGEYLVEK